MNLMHLTAGERAWLALVGIVAIPYVALSLGAILGAELHKRAIANAQRRQQAEAATAQSPAHPVATYCPECAKATLATRRLVMPPQGIQALCPAHQRVPVYLPGAAGTTADTSVDEAQPLIRRVPIRFLAHEIEVQRDAERAFERWQRDERTRTLYVTPDGERWGVTWFYIDPVDPVWN